MTLQGGAQPGPNLSWLWAFVGGLVLVLGVTIWVAVSTAMEHEPRVAQPQCAAGAPEWAQQSRDACRAWNQQRNSGTGAGSDPGSRLEPGPPPSQPDPHEEYKNQYNCSIDPTSMFCDR